MHNHTALPWAHGPFLVVPYQPFSGTPTKNDRILAECEKHPERFTLPMSRSDIRVNVAWYLTDPDNRVWEVWNGQQICGTFLMTRITPGVDALWHFVFFDGDLLGKRSLLTAFAERAFDELNLQRLSLEIPEHVKTLIKFARTKLGFRYEGEDRVKHESLAYQGSRRERAHFDGTRWSDVMLLRLLRADLLSPASERALAQRQEP